MKQTIIAAGISAALGALPAYATCVGVGNLRCMSGTFHWHANAENCWKGELKPSEGQPVPFAVYYGSGMTGLIQGNMEALQNGAQVSILYTGTVGSGGVCPGYFLVNSPVRNIDWPPS